MVEAQQIRCNGWARLLLFLCYSWVQKLVHIRGILNPMKHKCRLFASFIISMTVLVSIGCMSENLKSMPHGSLTDRVTLKTDDPKYSFEIPQNYNIGEFNKYDFSSQNFNDKDIILFSIGYDTLLQRKGT